MKRLERSGGDRILLGVCGGLARTLGLDSDLVRVAFLLAVAADGLGWVVYLAAYFLIPETTEPEGPPREGGGRKGGLLLVALAVLVYLAGHGFRALLPLGWTRTWSMLLPLLLVASGALLIWPRLRQAAGLTPGARPRRSASDRVIAGVAGGIARETGVDSALLRLLLVAATVVSWITIPLYVLLVLVLPEEESLRAEAPGSSPPPPPPPPGPGGPPAGGQGVPESGR